MSCSVRSFSLSVKTQMRLDELMAAARPSPYLSILLPANSSASPPPGPPELDETGHQLSDYHDIARLVGVPSTKIAGIKTRVDFQFIISMQPNAVSKISEVNRLLKATRTANHKLARTANYDVQRYKRATERFYARTLSQSAVVDALIQLGMNALEEKVALRNGKKCAVSGKVGHAGQVGNKSSNTTARQTAAA